MALHTIIRNVVKYGVTLIHHWRQKKGRPQNSPELDKLVETKMRVHIFT